MGYLIVFVFAILLATAILLLLHEDIKNNRFYSELDSSFDRFLKNVIAFIILLIAGMEKSPHNYNYLKKKKGG